MGAGGLCYLGESESSIPPSSSSCFYLPAQPWPGLMGTEGLPACLSEPEEAWRTQLTNRQHAAFCLPGPFTPQQGEVRPLEEETLFALSKSNWEKQVFSGLHWALEEEQVKS